ncbi:hypothetical protein MAR_005808 [Mya arenaria]|uniref:Uncharacterized protein n=1 Tax=Mya arenaria TaxID=6604 RepID=A0ABY7F0J2_MYAAR|nr:hypothetical protein MAR_005808 [Mya arenaria]
MSDLGKTAYAFVLKMLATTASVTSILPARYCQDFDQVISDCNDSESAQNIRFNSGMTEMRKYAPELHDLIARTKKSGVNQLVGTRKPGGNQLVFCITCLKEQDTNTMANVVSVAKMRILLPNKIGWGKWESYGCVPAQPHEEAVPQSGTYNPEKYGRAYYFNQSGSKGRNIRKFTTGEEMSLKRMLTMIMLPMTLSGATIFPPRPWSLLWLPYDKGRRPSSFTVFTPGKTSF